MLYRIGVENRNDGFRTAAWGLAHPGCFAYDRNLNEAIHFLPKTPREWLERVRISLVELLPQPEAVKQAGGQDGELWSLCKMLRRAVWHERGLIEYIRKLI